MNPFSELKTKWQGSCFLILIFPICPQHELQALKRQFASSFVKILWGDQCYDSGFGSRYIDAEDLDDGRETLLLDLHEIANEYENWPDAIEINSQGIKTKISIVFSEPKRTKPPVRESGEKQKERLC